MSDAKFYTEMLPAPAVAPVRFLRVPMPALSASSWQAQSGVTVLEYLDQSRRIVAPPRYRKPLRANWVPDHSIVDQDLNDALLACDAMPTCEVVPGMPVTEWFAETGTYSISPRISAWSIEDLREAELGMVQAQFERVVRGAATISGSSVVVAEAPCVVAYLPVVFGEVTVSWGYQDGKLLAMSIDFQEATFQ